MSSNLHPDFINHGPDGYVTTHEFHYTPLKFPEISLNKMGAMTYICHGMPPVYLKSPAYRLQALRSLWMGKAGALALVVGEVWRKVEKGEVTDLLWTFSNDCVINWTKPGAVKIDRRHFIKFQVMTAPEVFAGSTKIELDGEVALAYIVDNTRGTVSR